MTELWQVKYVLRLEPNSEAMFTPATSNGFVFDHSRADKIWDQQIRFQRGITVI